MKKGITFCIQKGYTGREAIAIRLSAEKLGATCVWRDYPFADEIPIGTVEFCELVFGAHRKDFYPEFLKPMFHREIIRACMGKLPEPLFIKDALMWKSEFKSTVRPTKFVIDRAVWVSEVVEFVDEWRYYVANGKVVTTGWYAGTPDGQGEDAAAPELDAAWPEGFSGAVDFGTLKDGPVALVEAHAPFACGWYGEHHEDYALWQAVAWEHRSWWHGNTKLDA